MRCHKIYGTPRIFKGCHLKRHSTRESVHPELAPAYNVTQRGDGSPTSPVHLKVNFLENGTYAVSFPSRHSKVP